MNENKIPNFNIETALLKPFTSLIYGAYFMVRGNVWRLNLRVSTES